MSFSMERFREGLLSHDDTVMRTYLEETGFSNLLEVPLQVCTDFFLLLKTEDAVDLETISEERMIEVLRNLNELQAVYSPEVTKSMFRSKLGEIRTVKRRVL